MQVRLGFKKDKLHTYTTQWGEFFIQVKDARFHKESKKFLELAARNLIEVCKKGSAQCFNLYFLRGPGNDREGPTQQLPVGTPTSSLQCERTWSNITSDCLALQFLHMFFVIKQELKSSHLLTHFPIIIESRVFLTNWIKSDMKQLSVWKQYANCVGTHCIVCQ